MAEARAAAVASVGASLLDPAVSPIGYAAGLKAVSADAALRMAEAELLLVDAQAATTEAATLAPAEADDPELNAALAAAT